MLTADKNALRTRLKASLLSIRQRELTFYTNNCTALGTNSLLIASFSWWALTEPPFDEYGNDLVQTIYLLFSASIMALQLLVSVDATLCGVLGPALAIRGQDGAMHQAVDGMVSHYRFTLTCFCLGVVLFEFSIVSYMWMLYSWGVTLTPSLAERVPTNSTARVCRAAAGRVARPLIAHVPPPPPPSPSGRACMPSLPLQTSRS
jgi:uncharacterized membrane protein